MSEETTARTGTSPVLGSSLVAFVLGVIAVATIGLPPVSVVTAIGAVSVALVARRTLTREGRLRGARLSLLGFIAGAVAMAVALYPLALGVFLRLFSS